MRRAFDPEETFEMIFYPHAAVRPDRLLVHVEGPEGESLTAHGLGTKAGDTVVLDRPLDREIRLGVSFER